MKPEKLFDFHVHCYPEFLANRAVTSVAVGRKDQTDGTLTNQQRWMETHSVTNCAILNMASKPGNMRHVNEFALRAAQMSGCVAFGSVHPLAKDALAELDWLYAHGIRGVKFHTGHQQFDFDDPACLPVYRRIGELGMVTVVHCGSSQKSQLHLVWPHTVARVIDAFDGAPFICAHMGGVNIEDPEFTLLQQMPVYTDTALATRWMDAEHFAAAVRLLGSRRVLFGSDLPWGDFDASLRLVRAGAACDPELDTEMILHDNAARLTRYMGSSKG